MYAFLDGEMEPGQHSALQHHLEQCSPCLEAFEFEAELKTVISHRCKEDVPQEMVMKVTQALMIQIQSDNTREPK